MIDAVLAICLCLPIVLAFQQLDSFHGKYHLQAKQFSNEFDNFDPQFPVMKKNRLGNPWIPQRLRPQRNRKNDVTRSFVRENVVSARDFIYPIHIHEDKQDVEIFSMPGCMKFSLPGMMREVEDAMRFGIKAFLLLPYIADNIKTNFGEESYNPDGLVPRAIKLIKAKYPDVVVSTEVGLHHYLPMGHDAIVINNRVVNDMTVEKLQKQAVMQAKAGSDMVVPSDMMDGRTGAIRDALDYEGFTNVSILACTASYDSSFCGLHHKIHSTIKKSYDVDPANSREALLEASLEFSEGADMLMVKPATLYLDIIHRLKHHTFLPMVAYHTCGEYAMLKSVAQRDWLDEKETVMESMLCLKRAGADIIISHYAKQVAKWINEDDHRM